MRTGAGFRSLVEPILVIAIRLHAQAKPLRCDDRNLATRFPLRDVLDGQEVPSCGRKG